MKKLILATCAFVALAGPASAERRDLSGFDSVAASGRYDVEIQVGSAYSVDVTGSDSERIRTRIEGDTLKIEPNNRSWIGREPRYDVTVRITMPQLESLAAERGADVSATGVSAGRFSLTASMGGEASASGACRTLSASASMGGSVEATALQCADADVSASMGGSAEIFANQSVDASASMGGSVNVRGEPARREVSTSMGGSVSLR